MGILTLMLLLANLAISKGCKKNIQKTETHKCKKCKCNLYFKSVYQLQETRATKAPTGPMA